MSNNVTLHSPLRSSRPSVVSFPSLFVLESSPNIQCGPFDWSCVSSHPLVTAPTPTVNPSHTTSELRSSRVRPTSQPVTLAPILGLHSSGHSVTDTIGSVPVPPLLRTRSRPGLRPNLNFVYLILCLKNFTLEYTQIPFPLFCWSHDPTQERTSTQENRDSKDHSFRISLCHLKHQGLRILPHVCTRRFSLQKNQEPPQTPRPLTSTTHCLDRHKTVSTSVQEGCRRRV